MVAANFVVCDTFIFTLITVSVEITFRKHFLQRSRRLNWSCHWLLNRRSSLPIVCLRLIVLVLLLFVPLLSLFLFLIDVSLRINLFLFGLLVVVLNTVDFVFFIGLSRGVDKGCFLTR